MELRARLSSLGMRPVLTAPPPFPRSLDAPFEVLKTPNGACARRLTRLAAAPAALDASSIALLAGEECLRELDWSAALFLDCETTGLSTGAGSVAFLVGVASVEAGMLEIEQFLIRDYGEEPALLWALAARLRRAGAVVTYNGKRFDLPLLESRFILARQDGAWAPPAHLDLLYAVRRLFGRRLESCALALVEAAVLGRPRGDDTPGWMMPSLFFAYLADGDPVHLEPALLHNRADLCALVDVLALLCQHVGAPVGAALNPEDRLALGRFFEARGQPERALEEYATVDCDGTVGLSAGLRRARLLRRRGRPREAAALLHALWRGHPEAIGVAVELAKVLEHSLRDFRLAVRLVADALERLTSGAGEAGAPARWRRELEHRQARLIAREGGRQSLKALGPFGGRYGAGLVGTPL